VRKAAHGKKIRPMWIVEMEWLRNPKERREGLQTGPERSRTLTYFKATSCPKRIDTEAKLTHPMGKSLHSGLILWLSKTVTAQTSIKLASLLIVDAHTD
jgi:hypothetical protein